MTVPARRPFLTARWSNLALVTFDVAPDCLLPHLPPECELDQRDSRAFVSLVAFDFLDTRVRGVRWPGHVNFPEINLRFYVTHGGRRGVCFIREFVPRGLIAWSARLLYNEPYRAVDMRSCVERDDKSITATHELSAAGRAHRLQITGSLPPHVPGPDSIEHFFKEHSLGFGRTKKGALLTYNVEHPVWAVYPNPQLQLCWDFGEVFGPEWKCLNDAEPYSTLFAAGSEVSVSPRN